MKIRLALWCVLVVILSTPIFAESAEPHNNAEASWILRKTEAGIRVYTRSNHGSPLDEFKGIIELKSKLSSLVALVRDSDRTKDWIYRSGGTQVLETISPYEQILRSVTLSPWPVSDRDVILKASYHQNPNTLAITIELRSVDHVAPKQPGYVRMLQLKGKWVFTPLTNGMVQVIYQVRVNPGGSIPGWLAGSSSVDTPFVTLKKMRELLKEPTYADASLEDVAEP
ncbi:MAG: START domain-containing protein [Pseudomonadales bacterium]|nr:START domain-containing protein [Pseudomonadales bacterium]